MTENEAAPKTQVNSEDEIDYDKLRTNWGLNVTKSTVRLKIWQILQLFGEMNVTQISNLLKESKSTVSRHLGGMVEDRLVSSRVDESCCEGRIPPKVFKINTDIMSKGSMGEIEDNFDNEPLEDQINFIKAEIQTNRSSIEMITGIMNLLLPVYNEVEELIKEGTEESHKKAVKLFKKLMWKGQRKNKDTGELEKYDHTTWFMFKYSTSEAHKFSKKIEMLTWKLLKEDFNLEEFESERQKLITEHKKVKELEHSAPDVRKKYGHFCIDMPLRTIFKRNLPDSKK